MTGLLMRFGRLAAVVGCCGILLAGCGKKDQNAASSGQVVAHVGDQVVTTQELENEFRLANIRSGQAKGPRDYQAGAERIGHPQISAAAGSRRKT